jgi:hypothetical protein
MTPPRLTHKAFLIVDRHGDMRIVRRPPAAGPGEWVFVVTVTIPRSAALAGSIAIDVPEPPEAEACVEFAQ